MSRYPRLVHWSYYNGRGLFADKNTKERLTRVLITDERGEKLLEGDSLACFNSVGLFGFVDDPYFKLERKEGYTTRAMKHGKMKIPMEENHPELEKQYSSVNAKVKDYVDYVFIDVAFLGNLTNSLTKDNDKFYNKHFVHKEHFNKEFLQELIDFKPKTLMGYDTISSYHKEELPEFFSEVKQKFPDLYKEALEDSEWLQSIEKELTLVGKKAKVVSLSPGDVEVKTDNLKKEIFLWDGKKLTQGKELRSGEILHQIIAPSKDMVVTIVDDEVVNKGIELVE